MGFALVIDSILEALSRQRVDIFIPSGARTLTYTPETYDLVLPQVRELRSKGIPVIFTAEEKVTAKENAKEKEEPGHE